jgi:hypothetical protein
MQDIELFKITKVTDDSTGIYTVGELDFGIPGGSQDGPLARYLEAHGEQGKQNIREMVEAVLKTATA